MPAMWGERGVPLSPREELLRQLALDQSYQRQLDAVLAKQDGVRGPCGLGFSCFKTHDTWGYHVTITEFQNREYAMGDYFEDRIRAEHGMSIEDPSAPSEVGEVFDLTSTLSEEDAAKVAEAFDRIRPLDADQKRNLLDILTEDYHALRSEIQQAFQKARRKAQEEVYAQFPEPETQVDRFRIEAEELLKAQGKAWRKLVKRAAKEDVVLKDQYLSHWARQEWSADRVVASQTYDTSERDKALAEARRPIDRAERAALEEVDRIQHKANRQIRLAAISKDASEILNTLPKAADITAKLDEAVRVAHDEIEAEKAAQPQRRLLGRKR
jgi:hypothetical protein